MILSLIAATDRNRVIGNHGALPWRVPSDLRHFKQITAGKPVLMGRATFESIGKPLPSRRNIVITRQPAYAPEGVEIAHSLKEALALVETAEEVFVIGGGQLYTEALPKADRLFLTEIDAEVTGDTFFPVFDRAVWAEQKREKGERTPEDEYAFEFVTYERIQ